MLKGHEKPIFFLNLVAALHVFIMLLASMNFDMTGNIGFAEETFLFARQQCRWPACN